LHELLINLAQFTFEMLTKRMQKESVEPPDGAPNRLTPSTALRYPEVFGESTAKLRMRSL
jgi:hypothetical protein